MPPRARHRTSLDPLDLYVLAPFQGLTITRELQPNGLHPFRFQGDGRTHASLRPTGHERSAASLVAATAHLACRLYRFGKSTSPFFANVLGEKGARFRDAFRN